MVISIIRFRILFQKDSPRTHRSLAGRNGITDELIHEALEEGLITILNTQDGEKISHYC